jgi:hypothetical protein
MKRKITLEVDDALFPKALTNPMSTIRMMTEVHLGLLIGPMEADHQRTEAVAFLSAYGVTLILDEQID